MKKSAIVALAMLALLLFFSSNAFATRFGDRYCYRSGSQWYCARYDNASFSSSGCAGTVPAPHLNLEQFRGSSGELYYPALVNWHVGWKEVDSEQCVIAYEPTKYAQNPSSGCVKFCYKTKTGQAGDILNRIGFPDAMKSQQDVSNVLQRLQISSGTSPFSYRAYVGGILVVFLGVTIVIVLWLFKCFVLHVCA